MTDSGSKQALTIAEKEEIIKYYDECQIDYELVWHLKSHLAMHYGYFYPNTKTLREALHNLNIELAKFGNMPSNASVLDAGCGVGGSSIFLAKNFNNNIRGITLSAKQVATATKNAEKFNVPTKCHFEVQDYLHTSFPDNYFDAIWAVESVCYAPDKYDFLKEAYRILKPGGRIMVADFFNNDIDLQQQDETLMKKWVDTWAINNYSGVKEFQSKAMLVGFKDIESKEVTNNVIKSIKRLYRASLIGIPISYLLQILGIRNNRQTKNAWSSYYQYKAYQKNLWKYMFFAGIK